MMDARNQAVQRVRDAAWRHVRATEEIRAAEKELMEAAHALDLLEMQKFSPTTPEDH